MAIEDNEKNNSNANKKRRNRKKKAGKGGKGNEQESNATAASNSGPESKVKQLQSTLNPHDRLRASLISEGYSEEQIDTAMEEMWNKQLPYDELDAVLKYLRSGGSSSDSSSRKNNNNENEEDQPKENMEIEKKEDTVYEIEKDVPESNAVAEISSPDSKDGEETTEGLTTSTDEETTPASPPMTLASKLDMVASFENFMDAAYALAEWASKAAKAKELEEFCAAQTTQAFPNVIRRGITESLDDNAHFENTVVPAILRLILAILKQCGVALEELSDTNGSFESVLKSARKAVKANTSGDGDEFAEKVAKFIVSRLSLAVEESKFSLFDEESDSTNGISSKTSNKNDSKGNSIFDLLSKRDFNKLAARKSSEMARSTLNMLNTASGMQNGSTPSSGAVSSKDSDISKSDIVLALLGQEGVESGERRRQELRDLKAQVAEGDSEHIKSLRQSLEKDIAEQQEIADKITQLKQTISQLESQSVLLAKKIGKKEAEIDTENQARSAELGQINTDLAEKAKEVEFNNSVSRLADLLKKYDEALDKAISTSTTKTEADNLEETALNQMDMYLVRARNYFITESECVEFIKKRITTYEKEIPDLKMEIAECETLGMSTTISQLTEGLSMREETLQKDKALLETISSDASLMFDGLINRLEQYTSSNLSKLNTVNLQTIAARATKLSLPDTSRLSPYVTVQNGTANGHSTQAVPAATATLAGDGVATANKPVAMTGQASQPPKFTWAKKSNLKDDGTAKKTSFLDIQKEEMASKSS